MEQKRAFSLLVENTSSVLSRVAGFFTRRGYNIDSIAAGVTMDPRITRITVVAHGDDLISCQISDRGEKIELTNFKELFDIHVLERAYKDD